MEPETNYLNFNEKLSMSDKINFNKELIKKFELSFNMENEIIFLEEENTKLKFVSISEKVCNLYLVFENYLIHIFNFKNYILKNKEPEYIICKMVSKDNKILLKTIFSEVDNFENKKILSEIKNDNDFKQNFREFNHFFTNYKFSRYDLLLKKGELNDRF